MKQNKNDSANSTDVSPPEPDKHADSAPESTSVSIVGQSQNNQTVSTESTSETNTQSELAEFLINCNVINK